MSMSLFHYLASWLTDGVVVGHLVFRHYLLMLMLFSMSIPHMILQIPFPNSDVDANLDVDAGLVLFGAYLLLLWLNVADVLFLLVAGF